VEEDAGEHRLDPPSWIRRGRHRIRWLLKMAVKALTQSNQEHLVLAQQIAETRAGGMTGLRGGGPWCITGQGSTHWSSRWQALCCCSFIWWSRQSRGGGIKSSFPFTQSVLPKLSGENPRIWIDSVDFKFCMGREESCTCIFHTSNSAS
jgi:hypothetical protein